MAANSAAGTQETLPSGTSHRARWFGRPCSLGGVMASYPIRVFGDPVLKSPAAPVAEVDGKFVKLVDAMVTTMYDAPGVGLAAPQVGVQQRFFVYDVGDGPEVLLNPQIVETSGEWLYEEVCLSTPGLAFEIVRPKL